MIGRNGERGSGISALAVRHDDDDDDDDDLNARSMERLLRIKLTTNGL